MIVELKHKTLRPCQNWHEWVTRWNEGNNLHELLGLLHSGFTVPLLDDNVEGYDPGPRKYDWIDRVACYLSIADGWERVSELSFLADNPKTTFAIGLDGAGKLQLMKQAQMRQILATKAFEMLALNFFKVDMPSDYRERSKFVENWGEKISTERLMNSILGFFRTEVSEAGRYWVYNAGLRPDTFNHHIKYAYSFLLLLATYLWQWKPETLITGLLPKGEEEAERRRIATRRHYVGATRIWMLEVLMALGRLDFFDDKLLKVDGICQSELRKMALQARLSEHRDPVTTTRKVTSVDEACYAGNKAALLLKRVEIAQKEEQRLKAELAAGKAPKQPVAHTFLERKNKM